MAGHRSNRLNPLLASFLTIESSSVSPVPIEGRLSADLEPVPSRRSGRHSLGLSPALRLSEARVSEGAIVFRQACGILSDIRRPTLAIVCGASGRRGRYRVEGLTEQHGDAKLTDLLAMLVECPKARSACMSGARRGRGAFKEQCRMP